MRFMNYAAAVVTVVLAFAIAAARAEEPLKIRMAWVFAPASLGPLMFATPEGAEHQGKSYTYEPIHFASSAVEVASLASGDIDIADLSFSAMGLAIVNAHIDDLRVFGDEIQDGVGGHDSGAGAWVLKDGPIKTVDDLKGKVIAVAGIGSSTDMVARTMLKQHGLQDKRDYSLMEAQLPNMKSLLFTKKADLVSVAPPYSLDPEFSAGARKLFSPTDALGPVQITALVARAGFLRKNHAALVDFMEDVIRSVRWYMNPANHAAALELVGAFTKQKPENIGRIFTNDDVYRDLNGEPNLAAIQSNLKSMYDLGFLPRPVDINQYADLSIVHEAAARFK